MNGWCPWRITSACACANPMGLISVCPALHHPTSGPGRNPGPTLSPSGETCAVFVVILCGASPQLPTSAGNRINHLTGAAAAHGFVHPPGLPLRPYGQSHAGLPPAPRAQPPRVRHSTSGISRGIAIYLVTGLPPAAAFYLSQPAHWPMEAPILTIAAPPIMPAQVSNAPEIAPIFHSSVSIIGVGILISLAGYCRPEGAAHGDLVSEPSERHAG